MKYLFSFFATMAVVTLLGFEYLAVVEVYTNGMVKYPGQGPFPVAASFLTAGFAAADAWAVLLAGAYFDLVASKAKKS